MKKLNILLIAFIATLGLSSCTEDDGFTFIAQEDPEGIAFLNSTSDPYTLRAANNESLAERFVWNEVDMGVPTTVRYELHGAPDETFSSYAPLGQDLAETNYAVTIGEMLALAEEAGLDNDPETEAPNTGTLYFRVRAYAGENSANNVEQLSGPIAINVVLPEATGEGEEPAKPQFYLVGDATAAGWDPANNNTPLFRDAENENIFYFDGRFAGGEDVEGFKLLQMLGEWQPQWGLSEGTLASSEILGSDPDAFPVASDAFYSFTVNTEDMTYTFEEIDVTDAATYETIGVIGDATPGAWDSDTDMTQSEFNPHIWYIQNMELTEGEFKFREGDAWDVNWGVSAGVSGQASLGSPDNMSVTPGTYNIWFNDLTGRYILIPVAAE